MTELNTFSMENVANELKDNLEAGYSLEDFEDDFHDAPWIAKGYALELEQSDYDIWDILGMVQQYEEDILDEIATDFSDPVQVGSVFYYMIAQSLINDISNRFNIDLDQELTDKDVQTITEFINNKAYDKEINW